MEHVDDRSAILRDDNSYASGAAVASASGETLFVINLCAGMTPHSTDQLPGLDAYRLYQVSRIEDGRRRYRLRLGFFTSETAAENVLVSVRNRFATAFISCLGDEDLKHASGYLKRPLQEVQQHVDFQRTGRFSVAATRPAPAKPVTMPATQVKAAPAAKPIQAAAPKPAAPVRVTAPTVTPATKPIAKPLAAAQAESEEFEITWEPPKFASAAKPATVAPRVAANAMKPAQTAAPVKAPAAPAMRTAPARSPAPSVSPAKSPAPPLTASTPPVAATKPRSAPSQTPFHVGAGVSIPDSGLSLAKDGAVKSAQPTHAPAPPPVTANAMRAAQAASITAVSRQALASTWRQQGDGGPTLDTTQTIRALTKTELEDAQGLKWFVVQLAVSDQPVNLDTMPRLDIFEAYRLYSIAMMENGSIRHCLRLGFFSEAVSAEAVMGYLKTFFGSPTIERISTAEHERFKDPPAPKPGVEPEIKSQARVITMEERRPASIPTINNAIASGRPSANRAAVKASAPAVRTAPSGRPTGKRTVAPNKPRPYPPSQSDLLLSEAQRLGLSDTAIIRVKKNPSLLARLVGKLTN